MEIAIGIDLGTTFSAVSVIDEAGKPVLVKNALGALLTPSVIYFEDANTFCVGDEAKEKQAFGEDNVASFFKRNM
jgi:molecular chaperone DnaK